MTQFPLNDQEYIELNKLLKILRWVNSGGDANMIIVEQLVRVNGVVETQKRKKLRKGDKVEFNKWSVVIS